MSVDAINPGTAMENSGRLAGLQPRALSVDAIRAYFVLAFAWSWGIGLGAQYVTAQSATAGTILAMLAGFGPSLAGFAVVAFFSARGGFRTWLKQCLNWRINWRWYAVAFFLPPAIMLLALAIHAALGGDIPASPAIGHISLAIANFGLVLFVGGPVGEEFGWRGYALPALAAWMGWRGASVLIGLIWGLWHVPLFFMANTPQAHIPLLLFLISTIAQSVMFAWLFVKSGRSLVPALVMHTAINAWVNIIPIIPATETTRPFELMVGIQALIALVLLLRTGPAWDISVAKGFAERAETCHAEQTRRSLRCA